MATISVPAPCTSCGGLAYGASWTSDMMFDDEPGPPPSNYGTHHEGRTVWIRQTFKFENIYNFKIHDYITPLSQLFPCKEGVLRVSIFLSTNIIFYVT